MPKKLPTPCAHPGCPNRCFTHKCPEHQSKLNHSGTRKRWSDYDKREKALGTYKGRKRVYKTKRWQKLRSWHMAGEPLCRVCGRGGEVVDHIQPISAGGEAFDDDNLQTLCTECHNQKTASEILERQRGRSEEKQRERDENEGGGGS